MPNNGGMEQISPIAKAARAVGGLTELARLIGVSPPTVHEWKTSKRPVPVTRCHDIIRVSHGAVTCQELRPNDWQSIWPELAQSAITTHQPAAQAAGQGV